MSKGTSGSSKNERRSSDRHLFQGHNKELTHRDPRLGRTILTRGNLGLSFSSGHVASVTAQHEAGTFTQCRFFRHAGQLQCRVRTARAKTVLWGG